ncbi:MAG: sulfite exporter TauE/SafE family protein [Aliarcobacter sp.]|nr:sulfite exporter TauE/SafE family protein [Aliarcobacter sp.]
MLDIQTIIYFLALGSFVGVISGLFGIGGGGIIVPVLTAMFLANNTIDENSVVHLALGTSMAIIIITSISSIKAQQKKKAIVWDVVKMMSPGIIIGTFLATFVASKLDSFYLSIIFAVFMFYSSIMMFIGKKPKPDTKVFSNKTHFFSGGIIGALSSLVSIGGGILSVPYLLVQNIDIKKAIATSSAIGFPIALSGTLGYIINGWENTSMDSYTLGFVNLSCFCLCCNCKFFDSTNWSSLSS